MKITGAGKPLDGEAGGVYAASVAVGMGVVPSPI
jgi:hypothetical protein